MSDRSPEISRWEDIGVDSDDEQVFYLDENLKSAEEATSESWAIIKPTWDSITTPITFDNSNCSQRHGCDHFAIKGCALEKSGHCCECSDKRPMMEKLLKAAAQKDAERQELAKHQCEHWLERGCVITSTSKCCACSDLRPDDKYQVYRSYVDGLGLMGDIPRWEHYCPGCKAYETHGEHDHNVAELTALPNCVHFRQRGCLMSATDGNCCACADLRTHNESGLYSKYVDGLGWTQVAERWEGYCPNCQRACSQLDNTRPDDHVRKHQKRMQQIEYKRQSKRAKQHNIKGTGGACDHWISRDCALTGNPKRCCACSDKRPEAPSYSMYVDGIGWIMGAKRWAQYCPRCRNHHEVAAPRSRRRRYRQMPKVVGLLC
ncbi:hypothetical protein G7054_g4220 [Neopestalotiopsis clavispora]|nr:hypothetical protein G7054_g4220 [Neopestalotiopsis clavispora]